MLQVLIPHLHLTTMVKVVAPPAATLIQEPGHRSLLLLHPQPRAAHSQVKAP